MTAIKKIKPLLKTFFPVPKYLSFDVIGIELSPDRIRAVKLKKTITGLMPEIYDEVVLEKPCNALIEGKVQEVCSEYLEALETLIKKHSMKYVVVSLPEEKTYIYKTQIPIQAEGSIEDAVSFTIEENVPLSLKDVTFDFHLVSRDNSMFNVIVSVVPRDILEGHASFLQDAGLIPVSFESESQALARSVIGREDSKTYFLMNLGPQSIHVAIAQHGIVHYASSFPVDTSKIMEDLEGKDMAELIGHLNKLLVFWFTSSEGDIKEKIKTAIFSGVYGSEETLIDYFSKHLKIDVKTANVWENCFSFNDYVPPISQKDSLGYAVAIGLSLSSPL